MSTTKVTIEWQKKHWARVKSHKLKWYRKNRTQQIAKNKEYYSKWILDPKNKEIRRKYARKWYWKNHEYIRECVKQRRIKKLLNQTEEL